MPAARDAASCAEELRRLADDSRFAGRAEDLRSLAADVTDRDSDHWAGVDLFGAFPVESTARLVHSNWTERIVGTIAAIAVFLPVGWTWLSFREASSAYQSMLDANQVTDGTTFLALWATGFDGRLGHSHQLVPMALISTLLIILAIATLVFHRVAAGVNVRREDDARHDAQTKLLTVLTQAAVVLNRKRADHPQRIEDVIKRSVDQLSMAHNAVKSVLEQVEQSTAGVSKAMTDLVTTVNAAAVEASALVATATKTSEATAAAAESARLVAAEGTSAVVTAMNDGHTAIARLIDDGGTTIAKLMNEGVSGLQDVNATSAERMAAAVKVAGEQFEARTVSAIQSATKDVRAVVAPLGSSARETSEASVVLAGEVEKLTSSHGRVHGELITTVGQIVVAVEGLDDALRRQEGTLQSQVSELSAARDAAERMLLRLSAAAQPAGGN